jgi:hypothetical protein
VEFSLGYPYYVHLVGAEAIDAMVDRLEREQRPKTTESNRVVTEQDFMKSLDKAVHRAFQSNLAKYKTRIEGLSNKENNIVKALCLADDRAAYTRDDLWPCVKATLGGTREQFDSLLLDLQQRKQIIRIGRQNDRVRFSDPLLAPFLRSWYYKKKMIDYAAKPFDISQMSLFGRDV